MTNKHTAYTYVSDTEAQCSDCGEIKPHTDFYKMKQYIHRKECSYYCKECSRIRSRKNHNKRVKTDIEYKLKKKDAYLKSKYNVSLEEYNNKLLTQDTCDICGIKLNSFNSNAHLDHCHTTGKIRSFLCGNCNRGIGSFHDEIWKLEKAIEYLRKYNDDSSIIKEGRRL